MGTRTRKCRDSVSSLLVGTLLMLCSGAGSAAIVSSSLNFQSNDQSMWGSGGAFQFEDTKFVGLQWNESVTAGNIAEVRADVPNPELVVWTAENALYVAELALYGTEYAAWLVAVGAWEVCDAADVFGTGVCGGRPSEPSAPTSPGPAPPATINVSLGETGAEVTASTTGRVGFELGVKIDSGSVDAEVTYDTQVITPENNTVAVGEFIVLQTSENLTGESLSSQFPTASADLSVVLEVSAGFEAQGCVLSVCTPEVGFDTGTIGGTQEIIAIDNGSIEYFGGSGFLAAAAAAAGLPTGAPVVIEVPAPSTVPGLGANIVTITAYVPQPNTSGGLAPGGNSLVAQGQDDLLDVALDVDTLVSLGVSAAASSGTVVTGAIFGGGVDLGLGFGVSYDLINVEIGPQIDLVQSFELTPTLLVDLQFSRPVTVAGLGQVDSLVSEYWENLPAMAFMDGTTDIFPTFYLGYEMGGTLFTNAAMLFNELFLDIDGNIKVDLLTATFSTPFGDLPIGIGNLVDKSFDLFQTPALYSDQFAMLGFNRVQGNMFSVTVPEPGVFLLFGTGFVFLGWASRRRSKIVR